MRIALVTWDWPAFSDGGVATLAAALAGGLTESGAQLEVWTRGGGRRARAVEATKSAFGLQALSGRSWRRRGREHWCRGVQRAQARFEADVLIVSPWDPLPGVLDALGPGPRPPVWVFAHGREITASLDADRSKLRAEVLAGGHRWLCLTEWMCRQLVARGVPPDRIVRVPAAVAGGWNAAVGEAQAAPSVVGEDPTGMDILTVGRLVRRKGHDVVLAALAELRDPALRYRIVGDGPERARLEALSRKLGLGEAVCFEGRLEGRAFHRAWSEADLFVMPAREEAEGDTEGYGLVFLEAGAWGLPVLGGRTAGAAEAIVDGSTGLLVDEAGALEAVVEALSRFRDNPDLRRRMGRAGRRRYEEQGRPQHMAAAVLAALSSQGPSLGSHL